MKQEIVHRRLYAFFNSKVLNVLLVIGVISLLQIGFLESILLPSVCAITSFALFIGYTLWLWIKKPKQITINVWLSNKTIWFTLYYLIVINISNLIWQCRALPIVAAIIMCFIAMVRPKDEVFDI